MHFTLNGAIAIERHLNSAAYPSSLSIFNISPSQSIAFSSVYSEPDNLIRVDSLANSTVFKQRQIADEAVRSFAVGIKIGNELYRLIKSAKIAFGYFGLV